jgi:sulfite exporter TauE/SafE
MVATLVSRALVLGLSTGLFCAGFCVPLVGPLLLADDKGGMRRSASRVGLFLLGRLVAYLLFGVVFGALGGALSRRWPFKSVLLPLLYAGLGLLMIGYAVVQSFPHWGLCRAVSPGLRSGWYVALVGFLAGINICPPFLLAVTTVMDIGGALKGALFNRFASVRFAARVAAVAAGLYFIFLAARTAPAR